MPDCKMQHTIMMIRSAWDAQKSLTQCINSVQRKTILQLILQFNCRIWETWICIRDLRLYGLIIQLYNFNKYYFLRCFIICFAEGLLRWVVTSLLFAVFLNLTPLVLLKASFMKMHIKNSSNSPYYKT